jgi:hypothetical protein
MMVIIDARGCAKKEKVACPAGVVYRFFRL